MEAGAGTLLPKPAGRLMLKDIHPDSFAVSPESSAQSLLHETKHCKQSVSSVRRVVLVKKEDIKKLGSELRMSVET